MTQKIVGIRFTRVGKIYHFDAGNLEALNLGEQVIVETSRGKQIGWVVEFIDPQKLPADGHWKSVERKAAQADLELRETWKEKEAQILEESKRRVAELHLEAIKIITTECSFDGKKVTITFSYEEEGRAELKSLRGDLQKRHHDCQIEFHQIGPRDAAKVLAGLGACGLECRCCSKFLTEFCSISIKMAKDQDVSLTPNEITGMCGRLRCCLMYEHAHYVEAREKLPRRNKHVMTPVGEGKVVDVYPLRNRVRVELPEVGYREFDANEITIIAG
jgi:cell fate regulator YaaT (PSP1 superfamily)